MAPQQNESTTIELTVHDDYTLKRQAPRNLSQVSVPFMKMRKEDVPQLPALKKNDVHTGGIA